MPLDFPLGESIEDPTRIMYLPYKSRDEGTVILGQTRFGKSSLLLRMVEHDIINETSAIVLDPHQTDPRHGLHIPSVTVVTKSVAG